MLIVHIGLKDLVSLCRFEPDTEHDEMLTAHKRWETARDR